MPSFKNFNDSAEYISRAEDRRAEHRHPRRKLGNYGEGFGKEKNPFLKVESKPRTKTFLMSSVIFFLSKFSVQDFCCRLSLFIQYWFSLNKIVGCPFGVFLFCLFIWCKFFFKFTTFFIIALFPILPTSCRFTEMLREVLILDLSLSLCLSSLWLSLLLLL